MSAGTAPFSGQETPPDDDRRRRRPKTVRGGTRANDPPFRPSDPPLTTRECADWMGMGTDYIVDKIRAGQLPAERFGAEGKRQTYRVHLDDFIAFLKKIGWRRIPRRRA